MNTPSTPGHTRSTPRRQTGAALIFVAMALVLLIAFGALAIDGSNIYSVRAGCQATADAAALAAASLLPDLTAARAAAISYGAKNMPTAIHGTVIDSNDVEFGKWDFDTRTFTANASQTNAVRVTTHRAATNNNALKLTLGRTFGFSTTNIDHQAVAAFSDLQPWDICLTQDVTMSFIEELSYAKQADHNLLDCMSAQSPAETKFGIVTFTGWGKNHSTLKQLATNYSALDTSITNIKVCDSPGAPVCSGTDIAAGLEKAVAMLNASSSPSTQKQAIVLVSDGAPTPDPDGSHPSSSTSQLKTLATNWANTAWNNQIHIFVVYFDNDGDTSAKNFVKSLVRGDGVFLSTPDAEELPDLLSSICGNLVNLRLVD